MGITGLLPLMKGATTDVRLSKLQGTVAAVDTNGWMHRACYHCGDKIYMNEETEMYINYCINYCTLLRKHSITPILVFDGQSLPAKAQTKLLRQKRKQAVRDTIEELLRTGNEHKARYLMRTCVDVNFEMVYKVIERCRAEQIDYIVAPYEADAQIAFLVNNGIADYAITEDSDMLVFGCKKTLYKLDREKESGKMVDLNRLKRCFKNFDEKRFQYMCILSGCDYLSNLPGIAIGRARKYFESLKSNEEENIPELIKNVPIFLKMTEKVKVTDEYIDEFKRAINTFNHQIVYSPFTQDLSHFQPVTDDTFEKDCLCDYAGKFFESKPISENNLPFVISYVLGNIHTKTLQTVDSYNRLEVCEDFWFSDLIKERIQSPKISSLKIENQPNEKEVLCDEIVKKVKKLKTHNNRDTEVKIPLMADNSIKCEFTPTVEQNKRNIFRKANPKPIVESRYFKRNSVDSPKEIECIKNKSDESDFDEEFKDILPKSKPNLDISTSSIEDDDIIILKSLNHSMPLTPPISSQSSGEIKMEKSNLKSVGKRNSSRLAMKRTTRSSDIRAFFTPTR